LFGQYGEAALSSGNLMILIAAIYSTRVVSNVVMVGVR
jgi:hypothetical protein